MNPTPTEWLKEPGNCSRCLGNICADCQVDSGIILDWSSIEPPSDGIEWLRGRLLAWRDSYLDEQKAVAPGTAIHKLSAIGVGIIDDLLEMLNENKPS